MRELSTPEAAARWLKQHVSGTLQADSRALGAGDGFIAWPGAARDARAFVGEALERGASACLVESAGVESYKFDSDKIASYAGLKAASGPIAAAYFDHPSQALKLLAVTGTNGKTSSAWWLAQALSNLKLSDPLPCAFVGTLGMGRVPEVLSTGMTTPEPVMLQRALRGWLTHGIQACAMEVSSIGLQEHRLGGTHIDTAIFTNLTQDHLDYHGTMAAYWGAKQRLFAWPGLRAAVVNIDDAHGAELVRALQDRLPDLWSVSSRNQARLRARDIHYADGGLCFQVCEGGDGPALQTRLIGEYNVNNLLGVMAAMRSLGVPLAAAVSACADLMPVPGRMQCYGQTGQPLVAVDYAHTPDALSHALDALRPLAEQRGGQLWCVFGCGGERDALKRPLMGAVAARQADRVVVTSDNPRSEKPQAIIEGIVLGLGANPSVSVQVDRARAIAQTLAQAQARDVVLIAGKGHEAYQEVACQRLPFSDADHVRRALALRQAAPQQAGATS